MGCKTASGFEVMPFSCLVEKPGHSLTAVGKNIYNSQTLQSHDWAREITFCQHPAWTKSDRIQFHFGTHLGILDCVNLLNARLHMLLPVVQILALLFTFLGIRVTKLSFFLIIINLDRFYSLTVLHLNTESINLKWTFVKVTRLLWIPGWLLVAAQKGMTNTNIPAKIAS